MNLNQTIIFKYLQRSTRYTPKILPTQTLPPSLGTRLARIATYKPREPPKPHIIRFYLHCIDLCILLLGTQEQFSKPSQQRRQCEKLFASEEVRSHNAVDVMKEINRAVSFSVMHMALGFMFATVAILLWSSLRVQCPKQKVFWIEVLAGSYMLALFIKGLYDIHVLCLHWRFIRLMLDTEVAAQRVHEN